MATELRFAVRDVQGSPADPNNSGMQLYFLDFQRSDGAPASNVKMDLTRDITSSDLDSLDADYYGSPVRLDIITSLRLQFIGKVITLGSGEQCLIKNINNIEFAGTGSFAPPIRRISNIDGGFFLGYIACVVQRGYNGTTIRNWSSPRLNPGSSGPDNVVLADSTVGDPSVEYTVYPIETLNIPFIDSSVGIFNQSTSDTIVSNNTVSNSKELSSIINEVISNNDSSQTYVILTQIIQEYLKVQSDSNFLSTGEFVQIINELVIVRNTQNNTVELTQVISEVLSFLSNSNYYVYPEILVIVGEILKIRDIQSNLVDITRILEVYVNELFTFYSKQFVYKELSQYLSENVSFLNGGSQNIDFLVALNEKFTINENLLLNADYSVYVKEIIKSQFLIRLNGELYEAFCVNIENNGLTRYDNFEFNSYCQFKRNYYALKSDGLFMLGGDKDDGEKVKSLVKTGYYNIANIQTKNNGTSSLRGNKKRLDCAYLVVKNNGQVLFRVYDDEDNEFDYLLNEVYDYDRSKIEIGSGIRSSLFQFEIQASGQFDFKECEIIPIVLNRKV